MDGIGIQQGLLSFVASDMEKDVDWQNLQASVSYMQVWFLYLLILYDCIILYTFFCWNIFKACSDKFRDSCCLFFYCS